MKSKLLLPIIAVFILSQFIFSCSNKEHFQFSATPSVSYHKALPITITSSSQMAENTAALNKGKESSHEEKEPIFEASLTPSTSVVRKPQTIIPIKPVPSPDNTTSKPVESSQDKILMESVKKKLVGLNKSEKKELKQNIKRSMPEGNASTNTILLVILAIIIPPLAVALYEGITTRFWISLLLTLLFIIPGIIYSLLVVTGTI